MAVEFKGPSRACRRKLSSGGACVRGSAGAASEAREREWGKEGAKTVGGTPWGHAPCHVRGRGEGDWRSRLADGADALSSGRALLTAAQEPEVHACRVKGYGARMEERGVRRTNTRVVEGGGRRQGANRGCRAKSACDSRARTPRSRCGIPARDTAEGFGPCNP